MDDRRRRLGGAGAGQLALRGERDAGDTRAAVAGRLADEQQRCFLPRFEVREQPLAAHGRALAVTIEVERRADPRAPQPFDELLHPHPHSDRRRPAAAEIAHEVAEFLDAAQRSLDLAQYDFHLREETAAVVGGALREAHRRGVAVRIIYNVDHANPIPVPPPPEPDAQLIASLGVPAKAIAGVPDLMHHKFVVRDGESLWTGSTNWTDDSWARQENVVVTVDSAELAEAFALELRGAVAGRRRRAERLRRATAGRRSTARRCGRGSRPVSPMR